MRRVRHFAIAVAAAYAIAACAAIAGLGDEPTNEVDAAGGGGDAAGNDATGNDAAGDDVTGDGTGFADGNEDAGRDVEGADGPDAAAPDGWCVHNVPTAVFCDDFDNGVLRSGWLPTATTGSIAVVPGSDASPPFYVLAEGPDGSSPFAQMVHPVTVSAVTRCSMQFDMRIDVLGQPVSNTIYVAAFGLAENHSVYLLLGANGHVRALDFIEGTGGTTFVADAGALSASQWHHVEIALADFDGGQGTLSLSIDDAGLGEQATTFDAALAPAIDVGIQSLANTGTLSVVYDNVWFGAE